MFETADPEAHADGTTAETTTTWGTNRIVVFVDQGSGSTGTVIATVGSGSNFRGVALAPHNRV